GDMSNQLSCGTSGEDVTGEQHGASSWARARAEAEGLERQHAGEWERGHEQLGGLATRRAKLDAEEAHLLRYAEEIKLWRGCGGGSMMASLEGKPGPRGSIDDSPLPCAVPRGTTPRGVGEPSPLRSSVPRATMPRGARAGSAP